MTATMKAVVLDEPGPVTNLHLRYLPVPEPAHGWVRIKVEAFGLNRSELHTRLGLAEGVTFPRVPGIEATGQVRKIVPEGVHAALELVGTPTLPDTLAAVRVHGTVCFTGMLSDQWNVRDFYPIGYLPNGVRLTAYSGDAADLPAAVLQSYLDRIASGEISLGPVHIYSLDDIQVAHKDLEEGRKVGKLVGRTTGR
jgi:NADPH2:quinone reductase